MVANMGLLKALARLTLTHRLHGGRDTTRVHRILAGMKTILIVDDERNIVELLRLYLEKEGFAVVSARDGQTALELVERHDPDLVVLDLMLPGMGGRASCGGWERRRS
jgi:PleD family two-component response regulator